MSPEAEKILGLFLKKIRDLSGGDVTVDPILGYNPDTGSIEQYYRMRVIFPSDYDDDGFIGVEFVDSSYIALEESFMDWYYKAVATAAMMYIAGEY